MPREDKYAGIVQSLTQAQDAVQPLLTSEVSTAQRVAKGINNLTQTLIDASHAKFLNLQLTQSTVSIGACVLEINGQQDINHADCLPIPEIDSAETFTLGIIVLQLLLMLNPRQDPAIHDYLEPLNLVPGLRQRLNRSPMALIYKLKNYYLQANQDTQAELLDLFPENLENIRKELQSANDLRSQTTKFAKTKPRLRHNTIFFQYNLVSKSLARISTILENEIKLITCASFDSLDINKLEREKINLVRDCNKNYQLYWLDRTCNLTSAGFPSDYARVIFLEENDDIGIIINKVEKNSSAYDEIKRIISTNIYIPSTDRATIDNTPQIIPSSRPQTPPANDNRLITRNPTTANFYRMTVRGLSNYIDQRTAEAITAFGFNTLAEIQHIVSNTAAEDTETTTSSEEPPPTALEQLDNFLEEVEAINVRIQQLCEYITTNKNCINNYLQAVQSTIAEFIESDDPNKHIYFRLTENYEVNAEQYFQDYKSPDQIDELNDEIEQAIAKLPTINSANLPKELTNIPRHNIQRLHEQQDIILAEVQNLEEAKQLAMQRKQELYNTIKKSPPLTINSQIFTNSCEVAPWYLRALTYKAVPYISAFIFAIGFAATIICAGLMLNNPAFIVFSLKTLNYIVTPLCISGIALGGTAAIVGGTGLVASCMFSNLRSNPDKLINANAPTINS